MTRSSLVSSFGASIAWTRAVRYFRSTLKIGASGPGLGTHARSSQALSSGEGRTSIIDSSKNSIKPTQLSILYGAASRQTGLKAMVAQGVTSRCYGGAHGEGGRVVPPSWGTVLVRVAHPLYCAGRCEPWATVGTPRSLRNGMPCRPEPPKCLLPVHQNLGKLGRMVRRPDGRCESGTVAGKRCRGRALYLVNGMRLCPNHAANHAGPRERLDGKPVVPPPSFLRQPKSA
jgi:hypothetical protein